MPKASLYIWDSVVRLCHWGFAGVFVANYFVLPPGESLHQWLGYFAAALVIIRLLHGITAKGYASFKHVNFAPEAFRQHIAHLRQKEVPANSGHNPFGWMMVFVLLLLMLCQAITGFMLEETDYFFGSSLVEGLHKLGADLLFVCICLHIAAIVIVSVRGNISLIKPMITGYRDKQ